VESDETKNLAESLQNGKIVDRALREAVRGALLEHKRLGHEIVVWRDGKVMTLSADEIIVPESPDRRGGAGG
jgi:hypothetical protein